MTETVKKISLAVIYLGVVVTLFTPFLVDNRFFFPFISTKVFLFRIVVEVLFLAYLLLNVVSAEYRPRWNVLTGLIGLFVLLATLSSLLGENFNLSFWGDMERGEGLVLWLHLLVFFVILSNTVRTEKAWAALLDVSVGASLLLSFFGLGQALKLRSLLATSGSRVDATLGNPAFFAAYLLFHLAFVGYLFFYRRAKPLKFYYVAVALFDSWLIVATETRGAVLGLGAGLILASILLAYVYWGNSRVRRFSVVLLLAVFLAGGILYFGRNQSWVQNSPKLRRLASISLTERTAENRLVTWRAAWSGWKEHFVFGWGLENFDTVFNKYFPPVIYQKEGSQVWFDRAHNVIFDRGVTTGIAGLLVFLGLLLYPFYYLVRFGLKPEGPRVKAAIIFASFILAYLVQDLFVFESITTYLILFFTWSFFAATLLPQKEISGALNLRKLWIGLLAVYAVAVGPLIWKVNVYPAKINLAAAEALRSDPNNEDFFVIVDRFKKALEPKTYGRQEYRIQFVEFIDQQLANVGEVVPRVKPVVDYTDEQIRKQIKEAPTNAKNYLLAMRYYNYTYGVDAQTKLERLQTALSFYPKLASLSPTRAHVPREFGYSNLLLYRVAKEQGASPQILQSYFSASEQGFLKAAELNPKVVESYITLASLYLKAGETEKMRQLVKLMDDRKVPFRSPAYLNQMLGLAKANNNFEFTLYFSQELTKLDPENADAWVDIALSYAYLGDKKKAEEIAQKIKSFGPAFVSGADEFIRNLRAGYYDKR